MQTPTYKKSDFKRISWEEYTNVLEDMAKRIQSHIKKEKLHIDAIVPIYRAGGIAAQFFAYKLRLLNVLPVQYKYLHRRGKMQVVKLRDMVTPNMTKKNPVLLVVENNHCFGTTAHKAISDLKKQFPKAKILYAATWVDYSHQNMDNADVTFCGKFTNEARGLSESQLLELGLDNTISLFPWEGVEEEWAAVSGKKFEYNN